MFSAIARGIALVEVIVFMVVVAVAAGAILSLFANSDRGSAELLINRQALTIAEAMLNEVLAAPFTYCDPNDANFATATTPTACTSLPEVLPGGPESGETRLGPAVFFDNVNDYNGFSSSGVVDRANNVVLGLSLYSVNVSVAPVAGPWHGISGSEMAVVTVTVTAPLLQAPVVLQGMRARFAPNTPPA